MVTVIDDIKGRLAETPEIQRVVLYGSRARADHDPRSDIDLAVTSFGLHHRLAIAKNCRWVSSV